MTRSVPADSRPRSHPATARLVLPWVHTPRRRRLAYCVRSIASEFATCGEFSESIHKRKDTRNLCISAALERASE